MIGGAGIFSYRIALFFSQFGFTLEEARQNPELVKEILPLLLANGVMMLLVILGLLTIIIGFKLNNKKVVYEK